MYYSIILMIFFGTLFLLLSYFHFLKSRKIGLKLFGILCFFISNFLIFYSVLQLTNYVKNIKILFIPLIIILISFILIVLYAKRSKTINMFKKWYTYIYFAIIILHICISVYFLIALPWALSKIGPLYHWSTYYFMK